MADGELFRNENRAVGYPLFLRLVHLVSNQLEFTIQVQHLLGLATSLLFYGAVRRLGAPVWAGAVTCAAVLLPIDQIFFEHAIMAEVLFSALAALSAYAAIRALDPPRVIRGPITDRHLWITLAGLSMAMSGWARSVAMPLVLVIALWLALAIPGSVRSRLAYGAVALVAGGSLVLGYASLQRAELGKFGLSPAGGWAVYARAAPFADCTQFDPPAGAERLCDQTPVELRPGPDFYGHEPDSPARQLYGGPPNGDEQVGEFGRAAIKAQPLDYLGDVGRDFVRYFFPSFQPQPYSGVGYELMDLDRRAGDIEIFVSDALNAYYAEDGYRIRGGVTTLADIQAVVRVHPWMLLASFVIAVVGLFCATGRVRWGIVLFGGIGLAMLLVPIVTAIWSSRYAVPAQGFIVAAGALGAWATIERVLRSRREPQPAAG
jgi:hypothetical protein